MEDQKPSLTLAEALKRKNILKKRIDAAKTQIIRYSSRVSTEIPYFKTDEQQQKEVAALVQSALDLERELRKIKMSIMHTNMVTTVTINNVQYTMFELLLLRGTGREHRESHIYEMINIYQSLCDREGDSRKSRAQTVDGKQPTIHRYYDEKYRNDQIKKNQDLLDEINMRLETLNNTTQLIWV